MGGRYVLGVLCVLFIPSTVFAQTDTIIEKIFESETRVREHVNQETKGIETKISAVDTKVDNLITKVGTLSTDVAVNKTNIENMKEDIHDLKGAVDRIWVRHIRNFGNSDTFYSGLFSQIMAGRSR